MKQIKSQDTTLSEDSLKKIRTQISGTESRVSGTAIFFSDGDKKYLLTAKHVVKENEPFTNYQSEIISNRIALITTLDIFNHGHLNNSLPLGSMGGVPKFKPFVFSSNEIDLAIISLQSSQTKEILNQLNQDKYIPIPLSLIESKDNYSISDDIIAIGFPSLSVIAQGQSIVPNFFQSNAIVLPITTFGKIAMTHNSIPYFIADITVYPGNSGGPIIKNNKLIGIVSGQILSSLETNSITYSEAATHFAARGTLAKIIKSTNLFLVLKELQKNENSK